MVTKKVSMQLGLLEIGKSLKHLNAKLSKRTLELMSYQRVKPCRHPSKFTQGAGNRIISSRQSNKTTNTENLMFDLHTLCFTPD